MAVYLSPEPEQLQIQRVTVENTKQIQAVLLIILSLLRNAQYN
jgi:hypothetical protein